MSLARLALRLAAIEALCPTATAATGPWPTLAGQLVYDTRVEPVMAAKSQQEYEAALDALEDKPLVTVYTEDDNRLPYGDAKAFADEMIVTLVAELMIASRGSIEITDAEGNKQEIGALDAPVTDRLREALLDVLEAQVRNLWDLRTSPSRDLLAAVMMETRQIHSDPLRDSSRGVRLAHRTVKFHIKVKKDSWTANGPSPLVDVVAQLPAGSSALAVAQQALTLIALPQVPLTPGQIVVQAGLGRDPNPPITPAQVANQQVPAADVDVQATVPLTPPT